MSIVIYPAEEAKAMILTIKQRQLLNALVREVPRELAPLFGQPLMPPG